MSIRRTSESGLSGYGVWGEPIIGITDVYEKRIVDISTEIPLPTASPGASPEPYVYHIVNLQWRLSVSILTADLLELKQFHTPTGAAQFGRYVTSAFGYVTDEQYLRYAKTKSGVYTCTFAYDNFELSPIDPCDEPQLDLPSFTPEQGAYAPYSFTPQIFVSASFPILNRADCIIADAFAISAEVAVDDLQVGVSYQWCIVPYTAADLVRENVPLVTIF